MMPCARPNCWHARGCRRLPATPAHRGTGCVDGWRVDPRQSVADLLATGVRKGVPAGQRRVIQVLERWSAKFGQPVKWKFCLKAARVSRIRIASISALWPTRAETASELLGT